ncbi:NAD(P)H-quinone oxidoreductase subunit I, chloroplastic [uncultured archaeon]|nr:NAD(P)H-quinone oxidoreductase subunit I, chloroplastic [uncultured archaeon]
MIEINRKLCIYCNSCTGVCPVMANRLHEVVVEHDPQKCIDCGACPKACPVAAITLHPGKKSL